MKRITPELAKAESRLVRMDKAAGDSILRHVAGWKSKRFKLIHGFSKEVTAGLVALKVITGEEVQEAAEHVKGGP